MPKRRKSYYENYWPSYETTRPIDVEDGIKAKSRRGKFVENWWADRWIAALKPLMDDARLSRGRSYARRGQVIDINVEPGQVRSRVQGSRATPYKVEIELKPLSDTQWERVLEALAGQAIFAAKLLNGEMPQEVEQVFLDVDVPLFPRSKGDLVTDCSCPDWANPCKHIAAVYYLLGERFDEDPFLLFRLRGRDKEAIVADLRRRRAEAAAAATAGEAAQAAIPPAGPRGDELLPAVPGLEAAVDDYWAMGASARDLAFEVALPQVEMALLKRLGLPTFGLDAEFLRSQLGRVYDGVSRQAVHVAFADEESMER
ncbi:MAG: SWIM zinc finger family protein [Anaerolineae bacterium]